MQSEFFVALLVLRIPPTNCIYLFCNLSYVYGSFMSFMSYIIPTVECGL